MLEVYLLIVKIRCFSPSVERRAVGTRKINFKQQDVQKHQWLHVLNDSDVER